MRNFIALIHKDPDSDYGVSFADFPGCVTAGRTVEEARAMAEEALAYHVDGMMEDGEAVPEPARLEDVMAEPERREAIAILVPLRVGDGGTVRVDLVVPASVLDRIDRFAAARGLDRSDFLRQAAEEAMGTAVT